MAIEILYEDEQVLAVSKPSGQLVIPGRGEAQGIPLAAELESHVGKKIYIVHRLDRAASGLTLFAKDAQTHRMLCAQFETRTVQKTYLVLVQGNVKENGAIHQPLKEFGSGRMGVHAQGKPSSTAYEVAESLKDTTLLEVFPSTGRRHQIRVHLYSIGHPVMGDTLYGKERPVGGAPRLMLHAWKIGFQHPKGQVMALTAPPPPDFEKVLTKLRKSVFLLCLLLFSHTMILAADVEQSSVTCEATAWRATDGKALPKGETLEFVLRWGIVTAGHATLTIHPIEPMKARTAYHVSSYARSTGLVDAFYTVQDHSDAWLDTQSLTTLRYEKNVREQTYRIQENADFDQPCRRYVQNSFRFDKNSSERREGRLPPYTMDVFGSLYYLRTVPLAVGQTWTIDVLSGDKIWPLIVEVKKRETIKVSAGKFDCFLLEPHLRQPGIFVTKGKKLEVWMTADERHMPVRMRSEVVIGHVSAELIADTGTP